MKDLDLSRYAVAIGATAALLAGCGGAQPPIGAPGATPTTGFQRSANAPYTERFARSYSVLLSFDTTDGAQPTGGLLNENGTLYGTTFGGGKAGLCPAGNDCGTIYSLSTSGTETKLYDFLGPPDGGGPNGSLLEVNGTLYGTTAAGGACQSDSGCGTVFSVTTTGTENVLYRFAGGKDGSSPAGGLVEVNGLLYGTTPTGGSGCGTVYSISPTSGVKKVLHKFAGSSDGCKPGGGLTVVHGTLYGTTSGGGERYGTVFSVTLAGKERVLYSFAGSPDGAFPNGGLLYLAGRLYGTTSSGGKPSPCGLRCGTVYSITIAGKEQVLYRFRGDHRDGGHPNSQLLNIGNTLYGTSYDWGRYKRGTVFSVTTTGKERVLYSFTRAHSDGGGPLGGLADVGDRLYGTTWYGGDDDAGTVFTLKP
jgi:uncharacterized repeat protein (TIGR03803 family)